MSSEVSSKTEVSQRIEFTCCYVFTLGDKPQLNAFRYKFEATASWDKNFAETGKVLEFKKFANICKNIVPDGKFLYNKDSDDMKELAIASAFDAYGIACQPYEGEVSAERILNDISLILVEVLKDQYPEVFLKETKLRESANSYVTWTQEV